MKSEERIKEEIASARRVMGMFAADYIEACAVESEFSQFKALLEYGYYKGVVHALEGVLK
jgi:hypothetical protein